MEMPDQNAEKPEQKMYTIDEAREIILANQHKQEENKKEFLTAYKALCEKYGCKIGLDYKLVIIDP